MAIGKESKPFLLLLAFMAVFVLVVLKGLAVAQPGDENTYYYMGRLVSEGKLPYRDFFYAHPPLHLYILALVYSVFGFNIVAFKLVPLASTLVSAALVFMTAKAKSSGNAALVSSLLFLFSYSVMFNSVFSFGVEISVMIMLAGLYFLVVKNKYAVSGIFLGLAASTRLLTIIPISVIFIIALFSRNKNLPRLFLGFSAVFLAVNGIFMLLAGSNYITDVYKFHLLKEFDAQDNLKEYIGILKLNWILFLSAFLFVFVKERGQFTLIAAVPVAYLAFLAALKKLFGFYFLIAFPFLAILGGYSILKLFNSLNFGKKWRIMIAALLVSAFAWNFASDALFLEKIGFRGFERGSDLASFINSASGTETFLFGDDSAVPLLALITNKKIALDIVDTNNQVFASGVMDLSKVLDDLRGEKIIFLLRDRQGISYFKETRDFLGKNCGFLSQFHDKMEGNYLIYKCG